MPEEFTKGLNYLFYRFIFRRKDFENLNRRYYFANQSTLVMNQQHDVQKTLDEIREMMSKSSKFISLSGISGILIGLMTIISVFIFSFQHQINPMDGEGNVLSNLNENELRQLYLSSVVLLLVSLLITFLMSKSKAKKEGKDIWGPASKQLISSMALPFSFGFVFCSILFFTQPDTVLPLSLLIYGFSLFSGSRNTINSVKTFGLIQMSLSILCLFFSGYMLLIWTLGFGLSHAIYGAFMHINQSKN